MESRQAVVVLSASYGSGHNQVAEAIRQAFSALDGWPVQVRDHFDAFVSPVFGRSTRALYLSILKHTPHLWGRIYHFADRLPVRSPLMFGMNRLGARQLAEFLARTLPGAVISVHPAPAGAVSAAKAAGLRVPHLTVFTDFVAHGQWLYPNVERYCVPCEEVADGLVERGISRERIAVTGIPIRRRFPCRFDREELRAKHGLKAGEPVVLVMAGAHATLGRMTEALKVFKSLPVACQGVFVCGRDHGLADRLRRDADDRIQIMGYVEPVEELMALADVLVTKAGAVTISEAIAMELPMILYRSLPGQEEANHSYLERAGGALIARNETDLARALLELLTDQVLIGKLRKHLRRLKLPDPAGAVARESLRLVESP